MVKCWLDADGDGLFHFKVNETEYFDEIVAIFKDEYCKYCKTNGTWTCPCDIGVKTIIERVEDYSEITISDIDRAVIAELAYPPSNELKRIKYPLDKEMLEKYPPLKGTEGHEDFQKIAIKKVVQQNRNLFNIACRHGKSYISIMGFSMLMKQNLLDCVLIICRPEGMGNYKNEILRFNESITEDDIVIITKNNREMEDYFNKKIIIISYNTFRLTTEYYKKQRKIIAKIPKKPVIDFSKWFSKRMIILDECQSINNVSAQTSYIQLCRDSFEYRLAMSGSLGYSQDKLYQQCKFLTPERLPSSFTKWRNYVSEANGLGMYARFNKSLNAKKMKEFTDSVVTPLMTTFVNCIPQPPNDEQIIYVEMSDKMRKIYQSCCEQFAMDIFKSCNGMVMEKMLRARFPVLKNVTDDISLMKDTMESMGNVRWNMEKDNPKLEILSSLLDRLINEENKRVIIWGNSPKTLQELGRIFLRYNPTVIHGDEELCHVKREEREDVIRNMRNDSSCKLLICNQVLSTSITLTEFTAQIWWSLPLNTDYFHQANQRICGISQKNRIQTFYMLYSNSIDNYIWSDILNAKMKSKNNLDSNESLGIEQLKEIFNPKKRYTVEGNVRWY